MHTRSAYASILRLVLVYFVTWGALPVFAPPEEPETPDITADLSGWMMSARALAESRPNDQYVTPLHFLAVIQNLTDEIKTKISRTLGIADIDQLSRVAAKTLEENPGPRPRREELGFSEQTLIMLEAAQTDATQKQNVFIGVEHLAYGLGKQGGIITELVESARKGKARVARSKDYASGSGDKESRPWTIDRFDDPMPGVLININKLAFLGGSPPMVGGHDTIQDMLEVLGQGEKNNVILRGLPGTGKTTVVKGLAYRIMFLPESVKDKFREVQIFELDLDGLKAGTGVQGKLEENLKAAIEAIRIKGGFLFMDEIHRIIANSGGSEADSIANRLKPLLTNGVLLGVIGATTNDEYDQYIEKDTALMRRFQVVTVEEPDEGATLAILRGRKRRTAWDNSVAISDAALRRAVKVARLNIHDRYSPDREIQILNHAAAALEAGRLGLPAQLADLREQLKVLQSARAIEAAEPDSPKRDLYLRDLDRDIEEKSTQIRELPELWNTIQRLHHAEAQLKADPTADPKTLDDVQAHIKAMEEQHPELAREVGERHVEIAAAQMAKMSSDFVRMSPRQRIFRLHETFRKEFMGNEEELSQLTRILQMSTSETGRNLLGDKRPNAGAFIISGASGTGRTKLAKTMAAGLYGSEDKTIIISGSEFGAEHSVESFFLGSPEGYTDSDKGSRFAKKLRGNPQSVLVFDRLEDVSERAWPALRGHLQNLIQDGYIVDRLGKRAHAGNSVIVFETGLDPDQLCELLGPSISNKLNYRVKLVPLNDEQIERMVNMEIERMQANAEEAQMLKLEVDDAARASLVAQAKRMGGTGGAIKALFGPTGAFTYRITEMATIAAEDVTGFTMKITASGEHDFDVHEVIPPHNCREDLSHLAGLKKAG